MIDNVVLLVTGTLHERDVTVSLPSSTPSSLICQFAAARVHFKASIVLDCICKQAAVFDGVYTFR